EVVGQSWSPGHRAQSPSLYDGTAGIALFLARLHAFTKDRLQKQTAIGALNRAIPGAGAIPEPFRSSVYSGSAGIAWATIEVGTALDDSRIVARGLADLRDAVSSPPNEACVDIIGGSAGTIQLLLDIAQRFDQPDLVDIASTHGQML